MGSVVKSVVQVAKPSALVLDDQTGEGHITVPADGDWDQADVLFRKAEARGYVELEYGEDEAEELPDGSLRFWLHNPLLFMKSLRLNPNRSPAWGF